MTLEQFVQAVFSNVNAISVVTVTVLVLVLFTWAVVTERIHVGAEFRRMSTRCETLEKTAIATTNELIELKSAAAAAKVRIEYLEQENARQAIRIQGLERELQGVQAELERIRETWTPPGTRRRTGRDS